MAAPSNDTYKADIHLMAKAWSQGRLVFFLGAGFNLADRDDCYKWSPRKNSLSCPQTDCPLSQSQPSGGSKDDCPKKPICTNSLPCRQTDCPLEGFLPTGGELSAMLGNTFLHKFPVPGDLLKVCQSIDGLASREELNRELDDVFTSRNVRPTAIHRFLAELCTQPAPNPREVEDGLFPLIVTTNYDDLVERSMDCDVLFYVPEERGRFYFKGPGAEPAVINPVDIKEGKAQHPFFAKRPVLLKIHGNAPAPGTSARPNGRKETYVISEDNYLDYLTGQPLDQLVPPSILGRLRRHQIVFLGYRLADWNVRVFLRRFRRRDEPSTKMASYLGDAKHWAVSREWKEKINGLSPYEGITLIEMKLAEFQAQFLAAANAIVEGLKAKRS